jgi:uncharacterized protein with HEPN domain
LRGDRLRLSDMQLAVARIRDFTAPGRASFFASELVQAAVCFELMSLGEAASSVGAAVKERHPTIPWKDLSDLRNSMAHEYFRMDPDDVWEFVERRLDELDRQLRGAGKGGA